MKTNRIIVCIACVLLVAACDRQAETPAAAKAVSAAPETLAASEDCILTPPPEPVMCTMQWQPVCGCDGKTYGNACAARAAGVPRFTEGECGASNPE